MFDYEYLESLTSRGGENGLYRMAADLELWIRQEIEKRREKLETDLGHPVRIYLTMRSYKRWPVFIMGQPEEEGGKKVIEAWYFHMGPPPGAGGVQLLIDRLSLRLLFPEQKPERPQPPQPQSPKLQPARNARVRPSPKPKGL